MAEAAGAKMPRGKQGERGREENQLESELPIWRDL